MTLSTDMWQPGRWVFQPLHKWETLPDAYYSMRRSQVFLKLFLRAEPEDTEFCVLHELIPPPELRGRRAVNIWTLGARAMLASLERKAIILRPDSNPVPNLQLPLFPEPVESQSKGS